MRNAKYDATVADFVLKDKGCFIVVTKDQTFQALMRSALSKDLGLTAAGALRSLQEPTNVLRTLTEMEAGQCRPLLIIERRIGGQETALLIKHCKEVSPRLLIVVLTTEVDRQRLMYLHELGADNFIAKPISAQTLVEKLAFTIKPQSQLGQLIDRGKDLLALGRPAEAREIASQILELKAGSAAGLMVLGDAEKALGNLEAARDAYLRASDNADLYLEPLHRLARLAGETGDQEERLAYLERLDQLSPLDSERKVNMGQINLDLGNAEKAETLFEKALTQHTREAKVQVGYMAERIAGIYENRDPAKAEEYLRKSLYAKDRQLTRDDVRTFNRLGMSLRQQGKWLDAVKEYQRALKLAPDDENLCYNLAMAYAQGKDNRSARLCLEKALGLNKDLAQASASVAYNMGMVFLNNQLKDRARACFEAALAQKPDMEKAGQELARL
ncbi:MAG: tetratricopeptide repeat protein [Deltaproteobacteria bacterium]|jgi:tetratricopeptide (TPR) repeat protein|nr:tetratricopeptide repeat protein [Deltaproteobacteria bacterium]